MYVRMSGHTFDAAERLLPALRYVCIHMMSYHRYVWMYVHMSVHMYDAADGFYPRCATCASSTLPRAKVTRRLDTYACRYVCISTCIHMIDIYGSMYICLGIHVMQQTASARAVLRARRGNYPQQTSRLD